jgi:hypothetical protein
MPLQMGWSESVDASFPVPSSQDLHRIVDNDEGLRIGLEDQVFHPGKFRDSDDAKDYLLGLSRVGPVPFQESGSSVKTI